MTYLEIFLMSREASNNTEIKIKNEKKVEGYLRYKTILFHKVALDVQLMNFFI